MVNGLIWLTAQTTAAGDATQQVSTTGSILAMVLPFGLMIVLLYFFMIRPQKKKEKETKNMRDNLQIGDKVTTIGGITGIIVRKTDDTVVIETGGEKNKIRVKTWAISENETSHDDVAEAPVQKKKKIE